METLLREGARKFLWGREREGDGDDAAAADYWMAEITVVAVVVVVDGKTSKEEQAARSGQRHPLLAAGVALGKGVEEEERRPLVVARQVVNREGNVQVWDCSSGPD